MTPENKIKNEICSYLRQKGHFIFLHDSVGIYDPKIKRFRANTNPYRMKGVSDILGIYKSTGRMLAIEVKTLSGVISKHQQSFLATVRANGGIAFMARSVAEVMLELERFEQPPDDQF